MKQTCRFLVPIVLVTALAGCGKHASPTVAPRHVAPVKSSLERAREAAGAGRHAEAARLLDGIVAEAGAGKLRNAALELSAFVLMSADPPVRDLGRARARLVERQAARPAPASAFELAATIALLDEALRLRDSLAVLETGRKSTGERTAASSRELRQLRTENAGLRADVRELRAELQRKDEALKRVAATVVDAPRKR